MSSRAEQPEDPRQGGGTVKGVQQDEEEATGEPCESTDTCEEDLCCPTALPVRLLALRDGLPQPRLQEVLRAKLRVLQPDSQEVITFFSEICAQLLSMDSEECVIFVTFNTSEELWKFSTYHSLGLLSRCMENLLLEKDFWLYQQDVNVDVCVPQETLRLMNRSLLMQEGSFFGRCTASQVFISSTSGADLCMDQGDVALFEPPLIGCEWTVQSLRDGTRGITSKPAMLPVDIFHQWFLTLCRENMLLGTNPVSSDLPQMATGCCLAAQPSDAVGSDELSFERGDRIGVLGVVASCLRWLLGRHEETGAVGLVQTAQVRSHGHLAEMTEAFPQGEAPVLFLQDEEQMKSASITLLHTLCEQDAGHAYRLDLPEDDSSEGKDEAACESLHWPEVSDNIKLMLSELQRAEAVGMASHPADKDKEEEETEGSNGVAQVTAPLCFKVCSLEEDLRVEDFLPLLSFLNQPEYRVEFGRLYGASDEPLLSAFSGYEDETELEAFLGAARETARRRRLRWAQARLCFLLGRLCGRRRKLSQARVYLEEALSAARDDGFPDLRLLAAIHSRLATVHMEQGNLEKFAASAERVAALRLGLHCSSSNTEEEEEQEPRVLAYALKAAILAQSPLLEARLCFLLARSYMSLGQSRRAVPYVERLCVLCEGNSGLSWLTALGRLYCESGRFHLALGAAQQASRHSHASLTDCLTGLGLLTECVSQGVGLPVQGVPLLRLALRLGKSDKDTRLIPALTLSLSVLLQRHKQTNKALVLACDLLSCSSQRLEKNQVDAGLHLQVTRLTTTLLWVSWLLVCSGQHCKAVEALAGLLSQGPAWNLRGMALRRSGDLPAAAQSFCEAARRSTSSDDRAVALANLGLLYLSVGEEHRAEGFLLSSARAMSQQDNLCNVLLELGQLYARQRRMHDGKLCYEWALLVAMQSNLLHCELRATQLLCHLYRFVCPDKTQCIIYSEHQLGLLRRTGDKALEAGLLESVGKLYLSLGTERSYRLALERSKRSLSIFIDLHWKEKEAFGWLQAGKIYHMLGQNELVDLYLQVAQNVGIETGDTDFILRLLEAIGDVFFDASWDRDKAVTFYRDRALPISARMCDTPSRLRLCNKLSQLLMQMERYSEALDYAQAALELSVSTGEQLNERVAYHRLATLYHCLGQYELAEHYYLKALSLCPAPLQFDEETLYYLRVYQTLGDITFYDLKDAFDAAGYYHLALAAAAELGSKRSQLRLCTRLATIHHNFIVDRELSLRFYQRARSFAAELQVRRINLSPEQHFCSTSWYRHGVY